LNLLVDVPRWLQSSRATECAGDPVWEFCFEDVVDKAGADAGLVLFLAVCIELNEKRAREKP
jgi:hypothetical protein